MMEHTKSAEWRNAESVYQKFADSGKKHLFLTGKRGSGKSTLFRSLLSQLAESAVPGITTWAVPKQGVFLKDNHTEEPVQIGTYLPGINGQSQRMQPLPYAFEALGCRLLERYIHSHSLWASIDEIGYLDSSSERYCQYILQLLEQKRVVAVLRKKENPFLDELKARGDVYIIDLDDRDIQ